MTDPSSRPLKIFLCHASADKPAVRKLYRYLRSKGMDPWLDVEKLLPGQRWQEEIPKALYASDAIIVFLSKNSVTKEGYVQREIKFALDKALDMPEGRIFLIPARLEECELPDSLKGYHWVDLFEKNWNRRLMSSLNERAAQLGLTLSSTIGETQPPVANTPAISPASHAQWVSPEDEESSGEAKQPAQEIALDKAEPEAIEKPDEEIVLLSEHQPETLPPLPLRKEPKKEKLPAQQPRETRSSPVTQAKDISPRSLPDWKSIASRFNSRGILGVGALLVVISLAIVVLPTLRNRFAPGIGSTMTGSDGMTLVYVPAGEFTMGSENVGSSDERPAHEVYLDAFWIDKTEVTVQMYQSCVEAEGCTEPANKESDTRSSYYDNVEFADYPVIHVDWNMAKSYCEWAGRRLPTEAEWEKAARGENSQGYPWGNEFDKTRLNFCDKNCPSSWADQSFDDGYGDTAPVGNYPEGASPYGAQDMSGNVWEWVSDWYDPGYYAISPATNPPGSDAGDTRVLRGGSFDAGADSVSTAYRNKDFPDSAHKTIGFRCVFSENAPAGSAPLAQAATDTPLSTQTFQLTQTNTPSPTETVIPLTPALGIGSTMTGEDGVTLLYVPAGEFSMGSDNGEADEQPVHQVTLDAFWIDQTEVTNKTYSQCVDAGVCQEPIDTSSYTHSSYYGNAEFDNYPVVYVDWDMAETYCEWANRRLPTEAEWEKAARGENAFTYPWGNDAPNNNLLNYNSIVGDTTEVGKYLNGVSPYGALDMAGNVWEWVGDWYSDTYYASEPTSNPTGPVSGQFHVARGGSMDSTDKGVRASNRDQNSPQNTPNEEIGFRCAMSATP